MNLWALLATALLPILGACVHEYTEKRSRIGLVVTMPLTTICMIIVVANLAGVRVP
jgi:MFS-type transporter involved in bile tolerance (Atg22 family)